MRLLILGFLFSQLAFAGTELKLNSGLISTKNRSVVVQDHLANQTEWIIQFKNHITENLKTQLSAKGIKINSYLPEDALIVQADYKVIEKIKSNSNIQAILPFQAEMKLSPTLGNLSSLTQETRQTFLVSLFNSAEGAAVQKKIKEISKDILVQRISGENIVLTASRRYLKQMASLAGVENIQAFLQVEPLHKSFDSSDISINEAGDYTDLTGFETGTKVMGFETPWELGISGEGQVVGMADTGLDSGDTKAIHSDFQSAIKSGYAVGLFGKTWADPMGHGTHVAGSVLGRGTKSGGKLRGGAFSAQMVAQGMWSPILNNLSVPANLATMFNQAYTDGARIHTNSWGAAANFGAYEKMAASVDQVMFDKQDLLIVFAAGNSGVDKNRDARIDANSIGTPGTSKNALTVGASENLLANGGIQKKIGELKGSVDNWPMPPMTESKLSDNINGLAMFSSRGPTNDGRIKPDVVAPGTNILSVKSQQPTAELLWGAYNTDYVFSGGTSMAAPLAAGAAAVVREVLEKWMQAPPTAALVKAYLLNSAIEMFPGQYGEVGAAKGQEILTLKPNNDEGYGRVDMTSALAIVRGRQVMFEDSKVGVGTTEESVMTFKVAQAGQLHVNLVWTDAPGSVNSSKALVNDLDLEVVLPNGQVLSHKDQTNNHEFVQAAVTAGEVKIRVKGVNVPMGKSGKQPFAVVATIQ